MFGSEDFIVAMGQQIAWLVSACQVSPTGLGYSHVRFLEDESKIGLPLLTFKVSSEVLPIEPKEPGGCWNEVLGNSAIVTGFPIPERENSQHGLELPLEVMAELGEVPMATNFNGGYLLKARTLAFVPVGRKDNSVQWHMVRKGGTRLQLQDILDLCPERLLIESLDEDSMLSTRAILGWCSKSTNILGRCQIQIDIYLGSRRPLRPSKLLMLTF